MSRSITVLIMLLVLLLVAGCGSGTGTAGEDGTADTAEAETVTVPEEAPDLMGRIKDIVGNEVTVYVAEMPAGGGEMQAGARQRAAGGEAPAENGPAPAENSEAPAGSNEAPAENSEAPAENRARGPASAPMANLNFTGETETFLIPVGVTVAAVQRGGGEAVRMELSELQKDQVIRVWKEDDAIIFVQVMALPGGSRQGSTGSGQEQGQGPADMGPPGAGGMGGPVFITNGGRQP